jgi:hypothetical protein
MRDLPGSGADKMAVVEQSSVSAKSLHDVGRVRTSPSIAVGWCSIAVGAIFGLVLGIWSFGGPVPVPGWIGGYDELPRRLLRLGHIAFFGLGILNIMLARQIRTSRSGRSARASRFALGAMNVGNVLLPVLLVVAAVFEPVKYALAVPATAVTLAVVAGAWIAIVDVTGGDE